MKITTNQLITRYRGVSELENYNAFTLTSPQPVIETARKLLSIIPPTMGACAPLSAALAQTLRDDFNIPAIVVAGDLKIRGSRVFKCKSNIPEGNQSGKVINKKWDGHCWVEIDGFIGDLSIFRTAYSLSHTSLLKQFIATEFGLGRGFFLAEKHDIPKGMIYEPKYVLNDNQIDGLLAGLSFQLTEQV